MSTLYGMPRPAPSETIHSPANPLLKGIRRAIAHGGLTPDGYWVAESLHLLREAARGGLDVPTVVLAHSGRGHKAEIPENARVVELADTLFGQISGTESSQGVIALVRPREWTLDHVLGEREQALGERSLAVVLDGIQDPGNAGAITRAAEAFGATGLVFAKGSTGPFHPKTLRASAGSLFRIPFIAGVEPGWLAAELRARGTRVYAAMPFTGSERSPDRVDLGTPCALVVGNEGRGVGPELGAIAEPLAIPTRGVESLNAAIAASVLLYEASRQRWKEGSRR